MAKNTDVSARSRAKILRLARSLFAAKGYAGTATERLVEHAGLTRGALYYHFRDKRDLFRAVFAAVQAEVATEVARAMQAAVEPWSALVAGCKTLVAMRARPGISRIVLVDGPAVLGTAECRASDAGHGRKLLLGALEACADAGHLRDVPLGPLAHLISGALDQAALVLADSPDDAEAGRAMAAAIDRLLGGLRRPRA